MVYSEFKDMRLSQLGFGTMRLPVDEKGEIDKEQVRSMTDYALKHGVNYFDTAYPYHGGMSERVIGEVLSQYSRDSYYLATKYPGHQLAEKYDPSAIFEEQLQKCGVEYFDFYLLHNVYEKSMETYMDPRWGIIDYFIEQRKLGRIRHLGFSSHARPEALKRFLDAYGSEMEFCQIQLNYLDWTLQQAKEKYEMLTERGIPVWVMEPLRGGKLAQVKTGLEERYAGICPGASPAELAFRFLQSRPNVKMILSGMSDMTQMEENVKTFETAAPLTSAEEADLLSVAEELKDSVPCTACRYCTDNCPMGLNIPGLLALWNDFRYARSFNVTMAIESMPEDKRPDACIACGACMKVCPQNIEIPNELAMFKAGLSEMPSWAEICRQREEAAKRGKKA